jgi:type I restriction enzyme S subunit
MSEWTAGRLANFAEVLMGTSPPGETTNEFGQGTPLLNGPTEFTGHAPVAVQYTTAPVKLCEPGDILFCVRGSTTGRMNWADRQYAIGRGLAAIRHRDGGKYQPYVRAVIEHALPSLLAVSTGSTFPSVSRSDIENVKVEVPPLPEQQAIACILGALDDKIELNRRRNRTLEAMARAIFQSWFVDFDPVKAKAAGRTPPGLSPALAALFPDRFEDSPLGPIPAGWRVGTVGDLAEINGWTLGKRDALDSIDYIEISEVMRGEIATITRYARGSEPGRARRRLRHGDTALSTVRPDRGAYFLSIEPSPNLIASTGFAILTALGGNWAFVHVLTTRHEFGEELGRLADGGAYPAVRPEVIAARPAIIPSDPVVAAFEKIAEPMFLSAEKARQESRTLAALRDALLPKLISGELRVPDAERIVGRAV